MNSFSILLLSLLFNKGVYLIDDLKISSFGLRPNFLSFWTMWVRNVKAFCSILKTIWYYSKSHSLTTDNNKKKGRLSSFAIHTVHVLVIFAANGKFPAKMRLKGVFLGFWLFSASKFFSKRKSSMIYIQDITALQSLITKKWA